MPLIWDNKTFMLVDDREDWNRLEFFVARKVRVEYSSDQRLTIDLLKNDFRKFGVIERIETFCGSSKRFGHITFKQDLSAYLSIIEMKNKQGLVSIRLADTNVQPENELNESTSFFQNLNDDCLYTIFGYCDIHGQATLSRVCSKFSIILKTRIFEKQKKIEMKGTFDDGPECIETACRIIKCVDHTRFAIKMLSNLPDSIPGITDNFITTIEFGKSEPETTIETVFFLHFRKHFDPICEDIKSVTIIHSAYQDRRGTEITRTNRKFDPNESLEIEFPNIVKLTLVGFSRSEWLRVPNVTSRKLHTMRFENGFVLLENIRKIAKRAELKHLYLKNCSTYASYDPVYLFEEMILYTTRKNMLVFHIDTLLLLSEPPECSEVGLMTQYDFLEQAGWITFNVGPIE